MQITGYDAFRGKITAASGAIAQVSDVGEVAAAWKFSGLLAAMRGVTPEMPKRDGVKFRLSFAVLLARYLWA